MVRPAISVNDGIVHDIQKAMTKGVVPPGIQMSYLGNLKNRSEGFGSLGFALIAAILFTYLIMVVLDDSYVRPFVVLFSIPVAMIGALLALASTMKALSSFSILGIIMLVGLVGKNAILLVDRANQMKEERNPARFDDLVEAGAEWKSGLAWALVDRLTSSPLLTLVLVSVVYSYVDGFEKNCRHYSSAWHCCRSFVPTENRLKYRHSRSRNDEIRLPRFQKSPESWVSTL